MMKTYIYGLKDPRDNQIYYIGKSNNPKKRLKEHLEDKHTNPHKRAWIEDLVSCNLIPKLEILEKVDINNWGDIERDWITRGRNNGYPLTNITDGGGASSFGSSNYEAPAKFISDNFGGELSILFEKVDLETQESILISMTVVVIAVSELIQRVYKHYGMEVPLIDCHPIAIGLKILSGETRLLELIDEAGNEMIEMTDKYISEVHGFVN